MSDNGTSRSAPRRGALLWLVGGETGHTKGIKKEAPAGASQIVKKVRTDFFDKLRGKIAK